MLVQEFLKFLIGNCLRIFTVAFIIYLTFENCFFHVITPIYKFFLLNHISYLVLQFIEIINKALSLCNKVITDI